MPRAGEDESLLLQTAVEGNMFRSQKDKVRGVTFAYINSNMKIVLHVPEKLRDDMDKGDICSGRWIVWYPLCKSTHKTSPTLFVKVSPCILSNIYLCLWESTHIHTP